MILKDIVQKIEWDDFGGEAREEGSLWMGAQESDSDFKS